MPGGERDCRESTQRFNSAGKKPNFLLEELKKRLPGKRIDRYEVEPREDRKRGTLRRSPDFFNGLKKQESEPISTRGTHTSGPLSSGKREKLLSLL